MAQTWRRLLISSVCDLPAFKVNLFPLSSSDGNILGIRQSPTQVAPGGFVQAAGAGRTPIGNDPGRDSRQS